MKEEFVTYEVSLKLKEKGFRGKCVAHYFNDEFVLNNSTNFRGVCVEDLMMSFNALCDTKDLYPNFYKCADAPTIDQVLRWLREVKGIDVLPQRGHINLDNNGKVTRYYNVNIYFERRFACTLDNDEQDYSTYEQATIAGIEYVIDNLV